MMLKKQQSYVLITNLQNSYIITFMLLKFEYIHNEFSFFINTP